MSSCAPVAKVQQQESRVENPPFREVRIGFAADLLGVGPDNVILLCKAGSLRARRNRHGTWWIDEGFLIQWHEANPNTGAAGCESGDGEERPAFPPSNQPCPSCPPGACESHWERRGRFVAAFRVGLCRRCYSGRALPLETEG